MRQIRPNLPIPIFPKHPLRNIEGESVLAILLLACRVIGTVRDCQWYRHWQPRGVRAPGEEPTVSHLPKTPFEQNLSTQRGATGSLHGAKDRSTRWILHGWIFRSG